MTVKPQRLCGFEYLLGEATILCKMCISAFVVIALTGRLCQVILFFLFSAGSHVKISN